MNLMNILTPEIFYVLDKHFQQPLKNVPKVSLRFLKLFYAWISIASIWYIVFGAWFLRGAGSWYSCMTVVLAVILSLAFFYESDGRGWKKFATLCVFCAIPRLLVSPIYAVAKVQTSNVNGTQTPDFVEAFHNISLYAQTLFISLLKLYFSFSSGFKEKHNDISMIWFVYYYNFMLIFITIQRVSVRKALDEKKQKVYAETLVVEEAQRADVKQGTGPMHI
ncbi:Protein CBG24093 [Caenorhabditis briggsae]|uniref:Protein CBG24093 n=1 Tax=Caenorhabditis briggsae TaxID=6238 RepID=A8WJY9_CAEBR|nr:Protein CBG24093 [Caenorhabditis briggsae]CAP20782.2 Protein CBG24093 [Caenorhabditis briggsae]